MVTVPEGTRGAGDAIEGVDEAVVAVVETDLTDHKVAGTHRNANRIKSSAAMIALNSGRSHSHAPLDQSLRPFARWNRSVPSWKR